MIRMRRIGQMLCIGQMKAHYHTASAYLTQKNVNIYGIAFIRFSCCDIIHV